MELEKRISFACTEKEEKIIRLRESGLTWKEIGKELGIGWEGARTKYNQALDRIKRMIKANEEILEGRSIMRVSEFDNEKGYMFRFILWEKGLRTLEKIASIPWNELGVSRSCALFLAELLPKYGLQLRGWKSFKEEYVIVQDLIKEFREWWRESKNKILRDEAILLLKQGIRGIVNYE